MSVKVEFEEEFEWTCGHIAIAVCGQCAAELTRRANALAQENLELRERLAAYEPQTKPGSPDAWRG